ncbi:BON domain-containing protein [Paraburkholderia caballeronis]|uniref:Osmotically-inducible protein Y n=1 Tax=Paraburkholderia caballeronis TaxID=416943 RepID=A0A1H7SB40_9BURK|nr:BON domain-containing protein [Paraburkholderia caballeronis]PXW22955.1 BON domain-containing protein [Paraburkholderia caballeronis]PXW97340.1 BON domain-containing protein [Paraburkholderia caballeronis]RAJ93860.1 BON domain-containing protein [Paraburkholderia caballeronis]TDV13873.1 BON domain-containing protein [Paraburkholderia caballeronis]TDV15387.1 BON domain-containing protein [Paraburkholderia caballeronis]
MKCIPLLKTAAAAACVTFALSAGAQTTTDPAPSGSSETVGQHVDDATITTKVKAELLSAKNVKSQHIHVKTRKGVVSLTGSVPSAEDRDNADQVAQNVSGVASVKNHLKVAPAQ